MPFDLNLLPEEIKKDYETNMDIDEVGKAIVTFFSHYDKSIVIQESRRTSYSFIYDCILGEGVTFETVSELNDKLMDNLSSVYDLKNIKYVRTNSQSTTVSFVVYFGFPYVDLKTVLSSREYSDNKNNSISFPNFLCIFEYPITSPDTDK